jgi:hypothetical protein
MDFSINAIPSIATGLAAVRNQSDVQTAVLSNILDTTKSESATMTKMMEQSVNPGLGENIDVRV